MNTLSARLWTMILNADAPWSESRAAMVMTLLVLLAPFLEIGLVFSLGRWNDSRSQGGLG
jgi:hypothetical protein